ncbi:hypothetical protein [Novosphingobium sp.]|uniref:hypothetical protein n=1 Tax=Novosphingobium sp. TaxID=1874826 RepID=UPI001D8DC83B|nr:hypothetical protein [Novosphingobium sp.]MBX9663076.1 hypothetical protein [Novosphingobium sp.]
MALASRTFAAVALMAASFGWSMAAYAQAVVIRSTGPSAAAYPMGRKLPAGAAVTLKAGDQVTVIDGAGSRVLAGPGSFRIDNAVNRDAASGANTALAALIARGGARTRTGAVRGDAEVPTEPVRPDNVWYVDVSRGGTVCIADPAQVVLWRPNPAETGNGTLYGADNTPAEVTFRAGSAIKLWPMATLPVVDGQTYRFTSPLGQTVKITTRVLADVPEEPVAVAAMLADKGCTGQIEVLASVPAAAE